MPLFRQNVSRAQNIVDRSQTIRNRLRLCFHIVVSSLLHCYSSPTRRNDSKCSISCVLFVIIRDYRRLVGDERKRCFHLRKLFVIKLSEGACNCLQHIIVHFTVVCLVTWPMNETEAGVDLILIESSLLFLCKFLLISMRTTSLT